MPTNHNYLNIMNNVSCAIKLSNIHKTYIILVPNIGQQRTVLHEGQDDHWEFPLVECDSDECEYVRVVKILHDESFI